MAEAATATSGAATGGQSNGAPAAAAAPAATAGAPSTSAGATLTSVPAGAEWANSFKNESLKSYVHEKKFTDPEQLVERYQNLEKLRGVPEDRLLKLPEKMEGDEARVVWEKLGAPKEAKGYELPREEKVDPKFVESVEGIFHKNNLTKAQATGVVQAYEELMKSQLQTQAETRKNAIAQADETLKKEWGQRYDENINLAKQGVRILGLDAKTLDLIEAVQGRDVLFKNLQRIGVSVGESNFVDGAAASKTALTPEQAQTELKNMINDKKFAKKVSRGDAEATARWNEVNRLAAPGEKQIK